MKVVTRSSVCQASPWAGTKGPEKSCWAYFSLHVMWKTGRGKETRKERAWKLKCGKYSELLECSGDELKWFPQTVIEEEEVRVLQWWTPLCRNWSAPAVLCAQSPSSHRYSCTKQNKLPIPALFSRGPLLRESPHDSSFSAHGPVECAQNEGREMRTFNVPQQRGQNNRF